MSKDISPLLVAAAVLYQCYEWQVDTEFNLWVVGAELPKRSNALNKSRRLWRWAVRRWGEQWSTVEGFINKEYEIYGDGNTASEHRVLSALHSLVKEDV